MQLELGIGLWLRIGLTLGLGFGFRFLVSIKSELLTPHDITVVHKQAGTVKLHVSLLLLLFQKTHQITFLSAYYRTSLFVEQHATTRHIN